MNEEVDGKFDIFKFLDKYEKFVKPAHEKYVGKLIVIRQHIDINLKKTHSKL